MLTGANAQIIAYSTYYRVMLYFILILILLVVASIYILVPIWGITGGAVAIAISIFVNNIMRYVFLNIKFKMQPFNYKILLISGIFAVAYFASSFLPQQQLIVDIILRSSLFSTIFFSLIVVLKISEDIDVLFDKYLQKIITSVRRKQRNNEG
jgi:O-antigen/teichoic acid export membrane protein